MLVVHLHQDKVKIMFKEMESEGPKLDINELSKLEKEIGIEFPLDYKEFLMEFNGGEPIERAIDFESIKLHKQGDYVATFYEVSNDVSYGILPNMVNHGRDLPVGLIYIASTPSGNYFLLSLREDSFGKIFYKDHEICGTREFDYDRGILPKNIELISESFGELLSRLYDPDE